MRIRQLLAQAGRGVCMGAADVVPGVSGGTVALVLGIYERLVANIGLGARVLGNLLRRRPRDAAGVLRRIEWRWLIPLGVGVGVAFVTLASVIERLLDAQPVAMAGLFFGLIAGSVVVAARLVRRPDAMGAVVALAVGLAMFGALGLRADTTAEAAEVVTEPLWLFFVAGALAICAMILPGVSGAFLLVLIGMYAEVLGAVNDRDLAVLAVFVAGCVIGLSAFSTVLNWLLAYHHDRVVAVLIGLMLGSLRVLWPWPGGTDSTTLGLPRGQVAAPVLLACVAFALVVGVDAVGRRLSRGPVLAAGSVAGT